MPRPQRAPKRRLDVSELSFPQVFELLCGLFDHRESPFEDDAHRRAAWDQHRARLLARGDPPEKRAWAFWYFETPPELRLADRPATHFVDGGPEAEDRLEDERIAYLTENRLLTEAEVNHVLRDGAEAQDRLAALPVECPDPHGNRRHFERIVARARAVEAALDARVSA